MKLELNVVRWIVRDVEGIGCSLFEVLPHYLPECTEYSHDKPESEWLAQAKIWTWDLHVNQQCYILDWNVQFLLRNTGISAFGGWYI